MASFDERFQSTGGLTVKILLAQAAIFGRIKLL
jgi:hypothetical protein